MWSENRPPLVAGEGGRCEGRFCGRFLGIRKIPGRHPPGNGAINGVFVKGSLNSTNLPSSVTLASLKTMLASGNAYINVHTTANPTGEIRGQVK